MTRKEAIDCMMAHIEYPQSICTKCKYRYATQLCEMRIAFKMAINALEESSVIDRVLEIIDAEAWSYCDYIIKHGNRNNDRQTAACHLSNIRNAVLALKGGDKE